MGRTSSNRKFFNLAVSFSLLCTFVVPISAIGVEDSALETKSLNLASSTPGGGESVSSAITADSTGSLGSEDSSQSDEDTLLASVDDEATVVLDSENHGKQRGVSSGSGMRVTQENRPVDLSAKYKQGVPCVPMMLIDDPNTLIVCDRDSIIRADKRTVTLSRGKGVYMVGKRPIIVETQLGSVTVPGNSAAIIEQTENGVLRVDHLTGTASTVAVKRWKGTKVFSAGSGEEICLAPKGLAADSMLAKDGIERQEVSNEVGGDGIMLSENKFAPKTMLDKECLLQCDSNSFFQVRRKVYMLRKSITDQDDSASTSCKSDESPVMLLAGDDQESQMKPVTLEESASVQIPMHAKKIPSALVKYNEKTEISFDHPSVTELKNGEAVFSTADLSFVRTPQSMIKIQPGALVLVSVSDDVTKVRTLWENQKNSVCQSFGEKPFYVLAGDESLASSELRSIYLAASKDMVGRRLNHYMDAGNGMVIHFSEVSLMSLAQSSDLLSQMMNSPDQDDQAIIRKLNKMAAILVQISASHGMYELVQPPNWKRESKSSSLMPLLF